ncbi:hypothetical protein Trydic_g8919 [Trypoxylus dichotomus]
MAATGSSLDGLLHKLGDFGKYQQIVFALICIGVIWHSAVHITFVFAAKNLDYRCKVPECDAPSTEFEPPWLQNAIPFKDDTPANCERFQHINVTLAQECSAEQFDQNIVEGCTEFVYKTGERTILNDFDLHCDENIWKLTLVGTIHTAGQFVGLGISGVLSDRYGRRTLFVVGMVGCGVFGIARSFTQNYIWFLILEFLDAFFLCGTYACCYILGVELVGPKKRVFAGIIMSYCFAVGEVLTAGIAWMVQSWRIFLLILYSPLFLFISYHWLVPESVRWLLSQKRYKEAQEILTKAAKVNMKEISHTTLEKLTQPAEEERREPLIHVFKSNILLLRLVNACFCWITSTFLFYGLTLNSVALAGNSYLDFILTALVEIPAYTLTYVVVDRLGRRSTLSGSFFITAVACFLFIFISEKDTTLSLCLYLLGKFGATAAFTILYVISSEIFPTPLRVSLMGVCSMFGRIGSMVSPQMPLLSALWTPLPLVLFSGMSAIAGFLTLLFPETLNTKLPDTIEEAVNIGKEEKETVF